MSRIRTIKPELWTSEQVVSCSPLSRLLFIGLWSFCDDNGVHPASYIRIKAEVFPADNFSVSEIKDWINELINNGLIREYMVDSKVYWIVTGWKAHQRIDRPTYRHPLPQSDLRKIEDDSTIIRGGLSEQSLIPSHLIDESSPTEWKGMDRIGMEKDICEIEISPACVSEPKLLASTQELFKYWQTIMSHPRAVFDAKRQRKVEQAFKLGYSLVDLKKAIDGCSMTPYNMGKNDSNQVYDDISLILRDAEHIERFINNATNPPNEKQINNADNDIMSGVL
ncbi:hypothetical protein [Legionella parisiensis]|uniref:Uncharacterized protein n=1 Tax=Legionella parisiensis TaxID=45071 RepID=A0A1E5JNW4_9GAMM|nr:hypothetical protein [Legionella parisiensis]KTD41850.1 hypothetical protein Lpar_3167 [Legionella parisiensis]OEH46212.1 hypothetical protein lpari_02550 [Legionella parisiensis]STX75823.1 Uncharacterised protein [Legionella parisiensis]